MFCVIVSTKLKLEYTTLLSAYRVISVLFVVEKSDTYRLKRKGEMFERRGTSALICFVSDEVLLIWAFKRLANVYVDIYMYTMQNINIQQ